MNARAGQAARAQRGEHPAVVDAIARFAKVYPTEADGLIPHDSYLRVHTAIVSVLIPKLDKGDARKVVEDDWENDRQGASKLDYARVFAAVFELVDLWTPGLSTEEYVSFVEALGHAVRVQLAASE